MEERIVTGNKKLETGIKQPVMVDVQERMQKHEVPKEIQTWLQKIEQDPTQQKTVNDTNGQPLLQLPATDPKIKVPVTRAKFADGFKLSVVEAGRWLSTFIFRLIKIKKGQVQFKEE